MDPLTYADADAELKLLTEEETGMIACWIQLNDLPEDQKMILSRPPLKRFFSDNSPEERNQIWSQCEKWFMRKPTLPEFRKYLWTRDIYLNFPYTINEAPITQ